VDIILTGIARSGTTLTCALLNKLPQTVALHEPMNPAELVGLDVHTAFLDRVAAEPVVRSHAAVALTSAPTVPPLWPVLRRCHCTAKCVSLAIRPPSPRPFRSA